MLHRLLRGVDLQIGKAGLSRRWLAMQMHVKVRTLEGYLQAGRASEHLPAWRLFELLVREDLLPSDVRKELLRGIVEHAGYMLVERDTGGAEASRVTQQVCEIVAATGELGRDLAAALKEDSDGGEELSNDERLRLHAHLVALEREVAQMRSSIAIVVRGDKKAV
jgi:hypothetical protein